MPNYSTKFYLFEVVGIVTVGVHLGSEE